RLAAYRRGELLHGHFPVRWRDHAHSLAIHARHERLKHAPRLLAQCLGGLQADVLCLRVVVVAMDREGDPCPREHVRRGRSFRHGVIPSPELPFGAAPHTTAYTAPIASNPDAVWLYHRILYPFIRRHILRA